MTAPVPTRPRVPGGPGSDRQNEPVFHPAGQAALKPWAVVAIWAGLLAVLAAVGAGFGNSAVVLEISGSAAGLVLAIAVAAWLDLRFRPYRGVLGLPVRLGGVFLFAVAAAVALLALAFGQFMLMLAAVPLAGATGMEIAARRRGR